jgi:hypothetical protein
VRAQEQETAWMRRWQEGLQDSVRRLHEAAILKRYNVSSLWAADGPTGHPMTARIPRRWLHSSLLLALAALAAASPTCAPRLLLPPKRARTT